MINALRVWIPHKDRCHRSPFAASVDRALLVMFPLLWEEELPARIAAALEALGSLEAETSQDRSEVRLQYEQAH
jgi:hypothetical protein